MGGKTIFFSSYMDLKINLLFEDDKVNIVSLNIYMIFSSHYMVQASNFIPIPWFLMKSILSHFSGRWKIWASKWCSGAAQVLWTTWSNRKTAEGWTRKGNFNACGKGKCCGLLPIIDWQGVTFSVKRKEILLLCRLWNEGWGSLPNLRDHTPWCGSVGSKLQSLNKIGLLEKLYMYIRLLRIQCLARRN